MVQLGALRGYLSYLRTSLSNQISSKNHLTTIPNYHLSTKLLLESLIVSYT